MRCGRLRTPAVRVASGAAEAAIAHDGLVAERLAAPWMSFPDLDESLTATTRSRRCVSTDRSSVEDGRMIGRRRLQAEPQKARTANESVRDGIPRSESALEVARTSTPP